MPWSVHDSTLLLVLALSLITSKLQPMLLAGVSPVGKMKVLPCKTGGLNHYLVLLRSPAGQVWNEQQQCTLCCAVPLVPSLLHLRTWCLHPSCLLRSLSTGVGWDGFQLFLLEPELGITTSHHCPPLERLWMFHQEFISSGHASAEQCQWGEIFVETPAS